MTRRIVIVIGSLQIGGTERQIAQIVPRLDRDRWRVDLLTLTQPGPLAEDLEAAGFRVYSPPFAKRITRSGRFLRLLRAVIALPWLWIWFLRNRPDLVHLVLPEAYLIGGLCALFAGQRRMIMSRRSLAIYQSRYPLLARIERQLHRHMALIVANSGAIRRDLRNEGVPDERIRLIANGVDTEAFRPDRARGTAWRATMGIGPDQLVLIIVANLIPYKGHADLIAALTRIAPDLPEGWRLLCIGRDDGIGAALQDQVAHAGLSENIRFLGSRIEIPALINMADISILSSHEEGLPNAVIEAMASGKPVVSTNVGGTGEIVEDGVTGILVPPADPVALAQAIQALCGDADRRTTMGAAARATIERAYGVDVCASAHDDVYQQVFTAGGDR